MAGIFGDIVKGLESRAADVAAPKMTKKALEEQRKAQAIERDAATARDRGFQPGENRQPFINPSMEELQSLRDEYGGFGSNLSDKERAAQLKETYIDPNVDVGLPPPQPRTREQAALPRKMTDVQSPRIQDLINNPKVRERIMEAARQGESVASWYDTTPLEKAFHDEFGVEEGTQRFRDFIGFVAGTSTGNKIGPNIRTASSYYNQKYGGGRDIASQPFLRKGKSESPAPYYEVPPENYGSDKQQTHMFNVNNFGASPDTNVLGGGYSTLDNPKIAAFYENLLGNWQPTTIDKHAMRLGAMASGDPRFLTEQGQKAFADMQQAGLPQEAMMNRLGETATNWTDIPDTAKGEYDALEKYWNSIADEMGISPAQLQAQAWVGGGAQTGLGSPGITFMDAFKDRIRRTAIKNNIAPDQVLKLMMHGKMTLAELEGAGPQIG